MSQEMVALMFSDKTQFLKLMKFPTEWTSLEMYPDDLASIQMADYKPGRERASEHFRNGAFHWWLKVGKPSRSQVEKLLLLASIDPDPLMGKDVLSYIRRDPGFDGELELLAARLFST